MKKPKSNKVEDSGNGFIGLILGEDVQPCEEKIVASRIVERTESVVIWEYQTIKRVITLGLPRYQSLTGALSGNHDLGNRWKYFPPGDVRVDTRRPINTGVSCEKYAGSIIKVYPRSSMTEGHIEKIWVSDLQIRESANSALFTEEPVTTGKGSEAKPPVWLDDTGMFLHVDESEHISVHGKPKLVPRGIYPLQRLAQGAVQVMRERIQKARKSGIDEQPARRDAWVALRNEVLRRRSPRTSRAIDEGEALGESMKPSKIFRSKGLNLTTLIFDAESRGDVLIFKLE